MNSPFDPKKCYLIAELGTLHMHDAHNFRVAIRDTFDAGADLVKIQIINPLTAWWASLNQHRRYHNIEWPMDLLQDVLGELNEYYKNRIFASIFDPDYVKPLEKVMPFWKVAMRMRDNEPMVARMIWTDKPIFFSTRGEFYNQDKARYFSRSENFIPLYATKYQPHDGQSPKIIQCFKSGTYKGISVNFGGKQCTSLLQTLPDLKFIEVHTQAQGAKGPDTEWALTLKELANLRLELGLT